MAPYLVKALKSLPVKIAPFLCQADLQRIHTGLGRIWYEKGKKIEKDRIGRYKALKTALSHYQKGVAGNPHDILAVRGLAQTTAELEFLHKEKTPNEQNPYNALFLFKQSLNLEPNGVETNYAAARYFHKKGLNQELNKQVETAAKIYPSISSIKNQSFYTENTRQAVKTGFEKAMTDDIMPASAAFSLSALAREEKEFLEAVSHYKKAMALQQASTADHYLALGSLLLQAGEKKEANQLLLKALEKSPGFKKTLAVIYRRFKNNKDLPGFIHFAGFSKQRKLQTDDLDLYTARAQIALNLYQSASHTLNTLKKKSPDNPECYYLLAMIAKNQKNWDEMELSIQRATVLDPGNSRYFDILSDALLRQKKYKSAEKYLEKALENDPGNKHYKKKLQKVKSVNS